MTGITPSAENFRAEMARHQLTREAVCSLIGMHVNTLSNFTNGFRPMPYWAEHNIGYAINRTTGIRIFEIEMGKGVLPNERAPFRYRRNLRPSVRLATPKRRRRRQPKAS